MRVSILPALLAALLLAPAPSASQAAAELSRAGKQALEAGRRDEAQRLLLRASRAVAEGDTRLQAQVFFDLALSHQQEAAAAAEVGDSEKARKELAAAASIYQRVLKLYPDSAPSHYNLALVYEGLEDPASGMRRAAAAYRRAAELPGEHQAFYQQQHAAFLARHGAWEQAAPVYEQVALAQPQSTEAHQALLERYLDFEAVGTDPLLDYLWRLVEAGQVVRAQAAALAGLERRAPGRVREELLAVAVAGLARQFRSPGDLLESRIGSSLARFQQDREIGPGVAEVLALLDAVLQVASKGGTVDPAEIYQRDFPWWGGRGSAEDDPRRGIWPREAFRRLMRSVGRWYEQGKKLEIAEGCYRAAAQLGHEGVDPGALRDLVELHIRRGDTAGIEALVDEFEVSLFAGKGGAYRRAQLESIYQYHQTLGELYGYLARTGQRDWGSVREPRSAIFQLQRAFDLGQQLDREGVRGAAPLAPGETTERSRVDPGVVRTLAYGYQQLGDKEKADDVVLSAAGHYQQQGDLKARDRVIQQVQPGELSPANQQRLLRVIDTGPKVEPTPVIEKKDTGRPPG